MEIKVEAGWHKGMGSQEDNRTAVLTYITISVPVDVFCTVSLLEFLLFPTNDCLIILFAR
jgi:hypothetical protein